MLRSLRQTVSALALGLLSGLAAAQEWRPAALGEAAAPEPLREFRGVWVATVANIDWPTSRTADVATQRAEMNAILDAVRAANFNAVIFQARPCCDAMYESEIEPWSEFLTGESGKAPGTGKHEFDPLKEWTDGAHARGLELHAWINPFRARHFDEKKPAAKTHISITKPGLVKAYDRYLWLDPGELESREHTMRVVRDILTRYDIDGIHIDDYFYPYPKGADPFPDDPSWKKYQDGGGKLARDDWRRDNINGFVKDLYETTKVTKRRVKVGISPFGIWKPDFPAGVKGMDSTVKLFADARLWLREGWMDYCSPQLYWTIDSPNQPFVPLLKWWEGENVKHRAMWPGLYTSKLLPAEMEKGAGSWSAAEIVRQVEAVRAGVPGSPGVVHFSAKAITGDAGGVRTALVQGPYAGRRLTPAMPWLGAERLAAPALRVKQEHGSEGYSNAAASWTPAEGASSSGAIAGWSIAVRAGGEWTLTTAPAAERDFTASWNVDAVSLRAVDRCGNLGEAAVWVRAEP